MNQILLCNLIELEIAGYVSSIIAMVLMLVSVFYMRKTLKETNVAAEKQMDELKTQSKLANETFESVKSTCDEIANNAETIKRAIVSAKKKERFDNLFEKLNENLLLLHEIAINNVVSLFEKQLPIEHSDKSNYLTTISKIKNTLNYIEKESNSIEVKSETKILKIKIILHEHSCNKKSELFLLIESIPTCSDNLYNIIN